MCWFVDSILVRLSVRLSAFLIFSYSCLLQLMRVGFTGILWLFTIKGNTTRERQPLSHYIFASYISIRIYSPHFLNYLDKGDGNWRRGSTHKDTLSATTRSIIPLQRIYIYSYLYIYKLV